MRITCFIIRIVSVRYHTTRPSILFTPCARLPSVHPVGWDFEALTAYERDKRDSEVGTGVHEQFIGWANDVPVKWRDRNRDVTTPSSSGGGGPSGGLSGVSAGSGSAGVSAGVVTTNASVGGDIDGVSLSAAVVPVAPGSGGDSGVYQQNENFIP